jgi:hypothetical protein
VHQAKRLIEAFMGLIVGRRVKVNWQLNGPACLHGPSGVVSLPLPRTGDDREVALLTRLAVHEAGHLTKTETGWHERLDEHSQAFFNSLEDARMEREQVREYPGAGIILRRGLDTMLENIASTEDSVWQSNPIQTLCVDLIVRGFLRIQPHEEIQRLGPQILARVGAHTTEAQRDALTEAVDRLVVAKTSRDAEDIAAALVQRLREGPPSPPAEQEQEQQEQQTASLDVDQEAEPPPNQGSEPPEPPVGHPEQVDDQPLGSPESGCQGDDAQPGNGDTGDTGRSDANPADDTDRGSEPPPCGGEDADAKQTQQTTLSAESGQPGTDSAPPQGDAADHCQQEGASQGAAPTQRERAYGAQASDAGDSKHNAPDGPEGDAIAPPQGSGVGDGQLPSATKDLVDIGSLLRQVHAEQYGSVEQAGEGDLDSEDVSQESIEQLAQALRQDTGDDGRSFDEVLAKALQALQAGPSGTDDASQDEQAGDCASSNLAGRGGEPLRVPDRRSGLEGVQSRLVVVLQRELQERKRKPIRPSVAGGRVLTNRFWRLATLGDTQVFGGIKHITGIDATATILIDRSASMGTDVHLAVDAGLAFSLALQRLNVRTRVVAVPGVDTVAQEVQRFGEPARAAVERAQGIFATGGTPLGAAMLSELPLLLNERQLKKFMVVATDGKPDWLDPLASALRYAQSSGVQVLGIGIGLDITDCLPNAVAIDDVQELPYALTQLFRRDMLTTLVA